MNEWRLGYQLSKIKTITLFNREKGKIKMLTFFTFKKDPDQDAVLFDLDLQPGGHRKDRAKDRILAEKEDRWDRIWSGS